MRVSSADPIDFGALAWTELLFRVETPSPFEQTLSSQYLMDAWNASPEVICRIKDRRIGIRDLLREGEHRGGNLVGMTLGKSELRNRRLRPHRPMSQQAAGNPNGLSAKVESGKQIVQHVVIVSRVESDFMGAPRLRQKANHVERLVTIERRDFNGDYVLDLKKFAPQLIR
jgi:hypothetical protein